MDSSVYLNQIPSQNRNQPLFVALMGVLVSASVDAQTLLGTFPSLFDIDVAIGDQLNKIGTWVGVTRVLPQPILGVTVLDDTSYRQLLKLFIAMNHWDGTVPGIYNALNSIFAIEGYVFYVTDLHGMEMTVTLANPPASVLLQAIFSSYFLLRPAGVGLTIVLGLPIVNSDEMEQYTKWNADKRTIISPYDIGTTEQKI